VIHQEALARWHRPGVGTVPPSRFIDTAERTGLIVPIGRWMLARAAADCLSWQDRWPGVGVAVNVSARQLELADITETVRSVLAETQLPPQLLTLEITESVILHDGAQALGTVRQLRDLGVRISLDDFGTGYSSLTYLRRLPIDELKLDRSFLHNVEPGAGSHHLLEMVISLGQALELDLVAEGIDTKHRLDTLRELGCPYGQGYLLGRPEPLRGLDDGVSTSP
jgi:EAL domain-containing protein (putative c-di-GMP-specific phosphodiesterase class I)